MMISNFYPPKCGYSQFNCPYCNVFAKQTWRTVTNIHSDRKLLDLNSCQCQHCNKYSLWRNESMIIPDSSIAPPPHLDLPESVKSDYLEASSIVSKSPRGATALLRLSLQKLMAELGESGENINSDIKSLVDKGLPDEVRQALDIVRVIGNCAVHPGELDIQDDHETALQLFELLNFIVDEMITRKNRRLALFERLPQGAKEAIAKRDR